MGNSYYSAATAKEKCIVQVDSVDGMVGSL